MAKKKRQAKSTRALRRRVARLEVLVAAFRGSSEGWVVLRDARISNGTVSAGGAVAEALDKSNDTSQAHHQKIDIACLRNSVVRGVRRAVKMFK
ncbi:hypothetical protein [Klebsiella sp. PL-2018]|uniref:hypothetical protein n=1 Tax=Klebsiella sp. PL-2018 TaxID=2851540 RepID=UPI001C24B4E3|nr:hypothetical protein [Klebsiella sp. PL-2018]